MIRIYTNLHVLTNGVPSWFATQHCYLLLSNLLATNVLERGGNYYAK